MFVVIIRQLIIEKSSFVFVDINGNHAKIDRFRVVGVRTIAFII